MKKYLIAIVVILLISGGIYYLAKRFGGSEPVVVDEPEIAAEDNYSPDSFEIIGKSVEGRLIRAFRFGTGEKTLVYIGALHGGYEWNSALLSYEIIDYLAANQSVIPDDIEVMVIPAANPDGLYKVLGTSGRFFAEDAPQFDYASEISFTDDAVSGRFNANNVDLNRNFDCRWQPDAIWRDYSVSAGTASFSEPETTAIRDFLLKKLPKAVVFFHSASGGVYTSFCESDASPGTVELLSTYSDATRYTRYDDYTYYEVTGDAADWLSTIGIPAITVELSTHTAIEWDKNRAGIEAMFNLYSKIE